MDKLHAEAIRLDKALSAAQTVLKTALDEAGADFDRRTAPYVLVWKVLRDAAQARYHAAVQNATAGQQDAIESSRALQPEIQRLERELHAVTSAGDRLQAEARKLAESELGEAKVAARQVFIDEVSHALAYFFGAIGITPEPVPAPAAEK